MIITRPLRLMILHFSHIGFTEGLTFIVGSSCKILLAIRLWIGLVAAFAATP